ncbi:hypothetical protein D3C81_1700650 [compost metagenome]
MATTSSSVASWLSRSGASPGRRWKSAKGILRSLAGPCTCTTASSAASATHMSEGWVATQAALAPRMAWIRFRPSRAGHPLPGSRLLQGVSVS